MWCYLLIIFQFNFTYIMMIGYRTVYDVTIITLNPKETRKATQIKNNKQNTT